MSSSRRAARGVRAALGACVGLIGVACRSDPWVIASEWSPEPHDAGTRRQRDAGDSEVCPTVATLDVARLEANPAPSVDARHVGLWRGTLLGDAAAGFPATDVELRVADGGQSSLRFGAPASGSDLDPSQGYLCTEETDGVRCATPSGFVGGFVYPLEALASRDDVLSFRIGTSDPWDAWCRLQAPQSWTEPAQTCGFAFGVGPRGSDTRGATGCARVTDDGAAAPMSCELMYALQHCSCAADGCVARAADATMVGLKLTDGLLLGSLWYVGDLDAAAVSLQRP